MITLAVMAIRVTTIFLVATIETVKAVSAAVAEAAEYHRTRRAQLAAVERRPINVTAGPGRPTAEWAHLWSQLDPMGGDGEGERSTSHPMADHWEPEPGGTSAVDLARRVHGRTVR